MNLVRPLALIGLLLPLVGHAQAVSRTFQWDAVTQNTDGSAAVVDSYTLYRSSDACVTLTPVSTVAGTQLTAQDPTIPAGAWCYVVKAKNLQGESSASNALSFRVPSSAPKAPSHLR